MAHNNYHNMMSLALDGLLASDEQDALELHLSTCAACTAAWEAMRQLDILFSRPPVAEPPPDFSASVMARVAAQKSNERRWIENAFWFVLLALLGVVMLAQWLPDLTPVASSVVPVLPQPFAGWVEAIAPFVEAIQTMVTVVVTFADDVALWLAYVVGQPLAWTGLLAGLALVATWVGLVGVFGPGASGAPAQQRARVS